ncbi:unnamed protein product, partial [Meganyctiphanes norvegica]
REFPLSMEDHIQLPNILKERHRDEKFGCSPFSNTKIHSSSGKYVDPPKWRCFLKGVTGNHLLITLLPATYHDLKLLLVKRPNLTTTNNHALKLVDDADLQELDTETNTTDQQAMGQNSEQQMSLESSTSSLTFVTSPGSASLPPPGPFSSRTMAELVNESERMSQHNKYRKRSASVHRGQLVDESLVSSRMRYKSGPPPTTISQQSTPPPAPDTKIRARASSFHSSRERSRSFGQGIDVSERNRAGSMDSPTKEPCIEAPDLTPTHNNTTEHIRKRYVSMPSKSHIGISESNKRNMSAETLRDDSLASLQLRGVGDARDSPGAPSVTGEGDSLQSTIHGNEPTTPEHRPICGAVTLPIYIFDCKLSNIINQLVTREIDNPNIGKDIYIDSTFKLEEGSFEDEVPLKDDNTANTFTGDILSSLKQPSPEPRSEESEVGDSSHLRSHATNIEVCHLQSFVLGLFQALQKDLFIHANDVEAALTHCYETVMEVDITYFLQTICGHLRDFRLKLNLEQSKQAQPLSSDNSDLSTKCQQSPETSENMSITQTALLSDSTATQSLITSSTLLDYLPESKSENCKNHESNTKDNENIKSVVFNEDVTGTKIKEIDNEIKSEQEAIDDTELNYPIIDEETSEGCTSVLNDNGFRTETAEQSKHKRLTRTDAITESDFVPEMNSRGNSSISNNMFPLSLLKQHMPCRELQVLHTSIRERFSTILQGSFQIVPNLEDYYYFSQKNMQQGDELSKNVLLKHLKIKRYSCSKKGSLFQEGSEDSEEAATAIEGEELEEEDDDEEEEEDDDGNKSIEFSNTMYGRLNSQLSALDEDKTSVISERDEDLSTVPDDSFDPMDVHNHPLFLHLTCTVRLNGISQNNIPLKHLPTCLGINKQFLTNTVST